MAGKPMTDKIMQSNLDWVYKRNHKEEQYDLDKVKYVKSTPREINIVDAVEFSGEFECFLPAYSCSVVSIFDNTAYPSFEHALLVEKYRRSDLCDQIRKASDIVELKRTLTKLAPQDEEQTLAWKENCVGIAEVLLRDKFIRNKTFKQKLISTGNKPLCFVNDYREHFWGMDKSRTGQNKLGKLLEQIRLELQRDTAMDKWVASHLKLQEPGYVNISVTTEKLEKSALMDANEDSYNLKYRNTFLIGQGQDCDLLLKDKSISRNHCLMVVEKESNTVHLIDMESSNGTEVDGVRLEPYKPTLIKTTAIVTFGALPINYRFSNSMRNVLTEEGFKESITEITKKSENGPASKTSSVPFGSIARRDDNKNYDNRKRERSPKSEFQRPPDRRPNAYGNNDRSSRGDERLTASSSSAAVRRRPSPSPPRRKNSPSPPRRKNSPSPPRRRHSPSPPRRRNSPSPPRRRNSPSPPRRRNSPSPPRRRNSPSPPRRRNSPSPPRRRNSPSPPRRKNSPSPPRRRNSPSPPRRRNDRDEVDRRTEEDGGKRRKRVSSDSESSSDDERRRPERRPKRSP